MTRTIIALLAVCTLAGCTDRKKESDTRPPPTRRERDSMIGESRLPGAQGVRGALRAADSAAARQKRIDAIH